MTQHTSSYQSYVATDSLSGYSHPATSLPSTPTTPGAMLPLRALLTTCHAAAVARPGSQHGEGQVLATAPHGRVLCCRPRFSFNNKKTINFVVNSPTQITVTVPTGASTGLIAVAANGGVGTSATPFTVTP